MKKDFLKAVIAAAVLMCAEVGVASSVEGNEVVLVDTKKPIQQPVVLISSGRTMPEIMVMGMQKGLPTPLLIHAFTNRGALAMEMDKFSIKAGRSAKIKEVRDLLVSFNSRSGSVAFSCEDSHVTTVMRKVLSNWAEEEKLESLMVVMLDLDKCDSSMGSLVAESGAVLYSE